MAAPSTRNHIRYGVPFYSAAWVPDGVTLKSEQQQQQQEEENEAESSAQPVQYSNHIVLAGGGGEGNSGVQNAILLIQFDLASVSLSEEPVAKLLTGSEAPYRIAVHPGGDGLICAFPNSCSWFEWENVENDGVRKLGVKRSDRVLNGLQEVGQQLALAFNREGSVLATGGEDGNLRVFKWSSMEVMFTEANAHTTVKQLNFSPDGKFLVSLGQRGPGRVWDVDSSQVVASLPTERGEVFCACKFSLIENGSQVLHLADKGGVIVKWNTTTWKRIQSKQITHDGIMSFDLSADGKLIACGTPQGNLLIINSANLRRQDVVPRAHSGFITTLSFSNDSRVLASASMDSSARVSSVKDVKKLGPVNLWIIILIILVAIVFYFINDPQSWVLLKSELEKKIKGI